MKLTNANKSATIKDAETTEAIGKKSLKSEFAVEKIHFWVSIVFRSVCVKCTETKLETIE